MAYLDRRSAYAFVIVASISLLVLFFFINQLLYILIAFFAIGGAQSLHAVLYVITRSRVPMPWRRTISIPCCGDVMAWSAVLAIFSIGVATFWAINRNSEDAWILQNSM